MSQFLSCYNDWCLTRNSSKVSDVIFLDLSKAFNSVPHERLLLKLNRYGIDGQLHLWFRNFLTNRKQRVLIRGSYSDWSPVISGVPRDSILGPVMFLVYVNDIPDIITSTAKLFADDTKIHQQINNVEDTIALQIDLTTLDLWADRWQMKFNPTKCEVMRISHSKDKRSTRYSVPGTVLTNVSNYKDLEVITASDLKWSKHVEQIVHKANRALGLLKRTVGGKNKDIFSNLYKTLFRSILEYACPVWSPHLAKDIMKSRRYKEELREWLYTKEDKRWRMRRGVKFLNGTL